MNIIDTHSHLFTEEFKEDLSEVVARAKQAGVGKILLPNIDENTIDDLKSCTSKYSDIFIGMMGLHPTSVKNDWKNQLQLIYNDLNRNDYIAVGEIGIDLYWDTTLKKEQIIVFEEQLKWSVEKNLPVSIHFRNATVEVINSIKRIGENSLRGVFHSFGGTVDELNEILKLKNFMIGVNGVVTFKNSGMSDTLKYCPKDRLVLESDSPYLSPMPYRGKRNESSYLRFVLKKISEVWNLKETVVAELTTQNALNMFGGKLNS